MGLMIDPFVRYIAKTSYVLSKTVIARDCRLLYNISGCGRIQTNSGIYPIKPNTLLFYPYGITYRFVSDEKMPMYFFTVNFDFTQDFSKNTDVLIPKVPTEHSSRTELKSIAPSLQQVFSNIILIPCALWAEEKLESIFQETIYQDLGWRQNQNAYLKLLLIELYRRLNKNLTNNPVCEEVKRLIKESLQVDNRLIAKRFGYHPHYLNELFKHNEGITLHQYIIHQRLAKAYTLITSTNFSFEKIAQTCGFCSQSHLSRTFKAKYHINPIDLRRHI